MKINKITYIKLTLLGIFTLALISCEEESSKIPDRNWQLVWQDEFNYDGALDETKWTYDLGAGGWGNNELQTYTKDTENVKIEEGVLKITAKSSGNSFTSARVTTKGLFAQAYGRFEARIKTPYGPGIWPAFWMLGDNIDTVGWPKCGEIDLMELRGQQPNIIHGSLHGPGYSSGAAVTKSFGYGNNRFDADFHVFAIEWNKDSIEFYVDDTLYQKVTPSDVNGEWVYNNSFFIVLNVAVGGDYVGFPTAKTPFPQTMYIDYVRVYKSV